MVAPWQERVKSASWSLLRWRAARRETEVPALVVEVMLEISFKEGVCKTSIVGVHILNHSIYSDRISRLSRFFDEDCTTIKVRNAKLAITPSDCATVHFLEARISDGASNSKRWLKKSICPPAMITFNTSLSSSTECTVNKSPTSNPSWG